MASATRLDAVPPMVSGDVPTAEKGTFEWYVGTRYQSEGGSVNRQVPITELVYGISDRQEITFEIPYFSQQGEHGFGDIVLGIKFMFLKESKARPGIAGTFELKLPSASASRGLGTGRFDYDLRVPVQKTWGWFTLMGNVGYTIVGEPRVGGTTQPRRNVWFVSTAQQWQVTPKTKVLSEVYLKTAEEPGQPNRFAADVGFEHNLRDNFKVHATVGRSLRQGARGGPDLRVYVGFVWKFDAPWNQVAK
ncbi:MAG: transporter [Chthoniobacteraceae bacterium]